jgi:glutamyl-tRNA synthetase
MTELGTSTSNVDLAMSSIYAENRELIDEETDRAFMVRDGVELPLSGGPDAGEPPYHPNHEERGRRTVPAGDAVLLEDGDVPGAGERVWLKGFGCVERTDDGLEYTGADLDVVREGDVPVVHWVSADENRSVRMRTMDGDVTGHAEPGVADYGIDDLLQFERVGFVRIDDFDESDDPAVLAYFTHS